MNFVIIGGVSVNDKTHDAFPYNFINAGIRKAKSLKVDVKVVIYAPSYELRATKQKTEHSTVSVGKTCTNYDLFLFNFDICDADKRHFLDVTKKATIVPGMSYEEIRSASDLTGILQSAKKIKSIHYFGHSNAEYMFLEYSAVVPTKSTVMWGEAEAKKVPVSNFDSDAYFASYGCNQGDLSGLAEKLNSAWDIVAIGSEGKTDFSPIGRGKTHPTSAGGYYRYDKGTRSAISVSD